VGPGVGFKDIIAQVEKQQKKAVDEVGNIKTS